MRAEIEAVEPRFGSIRDDLCELNDLHLLEITLDRLTSWSRPGLLAIGDAAHAMSPMGGIGINLAIQDAAAASNLLAEATMRGENPDPLLAQVQRRRSGSTKLVQLVQQITQSWMLGSVLRRPRPLKRPPWPLLVLAAVPALRRIPGRAIALGIRQERIAA